MPLDLTQGVLFVFCRRARADKGVAQATDARGRSRSMGRRPASLPAQMTTLMSWLRLSVSSSGCSRMEGRASERAGMASMQQ